METAVLRTSEPANKRQVGGNHYKTTIEHWDWAAANQLDYFQGCITKYIARWRDKGGLQDLLKAQHYLDKYIEEVRKGTYTPNAKRSRKRMR